MEQNTKLDMQTLYVTENAGHQVFRGSDIDNWVANNLMKEVFYNDRGYVYDDAHYMRLKKMFPKNRIPAPESDQ